LKEQHRLGLSTPSVFCDVFEQTRRLLAELISAQPVRLLLYTCVHEEAFRRIEKQGEMGLPTRIYGLHQVVLFLAALYMQ
jgi:hypothetical protein